MNEHVRAYWEEKPCGRQRDIVGDAPVHSRAWFERIERYRYETEPMIWPLAQFSRHHGKRILEVGVGAGTDHLQFARSGAQCHGVDLTEVAIRTTEERLRLYGFSSTLQRLDAESLPFTEASFDVVYSWGVIHHTTHPDRMVAEIHRVLRPGGLFLGMVYGRRSLLAFRYWIRHALLEGRPLLSFAEVIAQHMECPGTNAYSVREVERLFGEFQWVEARSVLTVYDLRYWPRWLSQFFPHRWGWFVTVRAMR